MKRREIVVDLVKAAFIVLIVKVMATASRIIPWNSYLDNLCIVFAVGVMFVKICTLTFEFKKLIMLAAAALLTLYTCVALKQYDIFITVIVICLVMNEDLDEYITLMLKTQAIIIIGHIIVSGSRSLIGEGADYWRMTGDRLRFNGGFVHANVLSCYIMSCTLMFAWKRFGRITANQFAWMLCITVLAYIASRSRTGLMLNLFTLLIIFLAQKENQLVVKGTNALLPPLFPALTALFFLMQKWYVAGNRVAVILDKLLTGRIKYAAYAYIRSGVTWLPRYLDYADSGVVSWTEEWNLNTFTFDSMYSFLFIQMGIVWVGLISLLIAVVCRRFDFKNKLFILIWVLYAIVEVHGLNCIKFFPLILLSTLLSGKGAESRAEPVD